jgi:hypothetical protein
MAITKRSLIFISIGKRGGGDMDIPITAATIIVIAVILFGISIAWVFKRYITPSDVLSKYLTTQRKTKPVVAIHSNDGRVRFTVTDMIGTISAYTPDEVTAVQQMMLILKLSSNGPQQSTGGVPTGSSRSIGDVVVHVRSPQTVDAQTPKQQLVKKQEPEVKPHKPGERFEHIIE